MVHVCVQKFDVIGNFENFWELNWAGRVDDDRTGAETASARRGQGVHLGRPTRPYSRGQGVEATSVPTATALPGKSRSCCRPTWPLASG